MKLFAAVVAAATIMMVGGPVGAQQAPEPPVPVDAPLSVNGVTENIAVTFSGDTTLASSGFTPGEQIYFSIYVTGTPQVLSTFTANDTGDLAETVSMDAITPDTLTLSNGDYFLVGFGETSNRIVGSWITLSGVSDPAADTTVPDTTVPDTTVPDTTVPDTTVASSDTQNPSDGTNGDATQNSAAANGESELPNNGPLATLPLILAAGAAGGVGLIARRRRAA